MSTPSRHRVWPWVLAIMLGICLLPVVIVASHIGLSSEAAVLRDGLKKATGSTWITRFQLKSGMLLLPARAVVSMCHVDDDARRAIAAVRSASVGVYELDEAGPSEDFNDALAAIDRRMARAGWERLVGVHENGQRVLIYTDQRDRDRSDVRVCVGVVDGAQLVVVSAKIRPETLVPLIDRHLSQAMHGL